MENKICDYTVLLDDTLAGLSQQVREHLNMGWGWQPLGPATPVIDHFSSPKTKYMQTLVRYV